ncbi:MAG: glutathione S-transferase family protein [Rhodobiaceae bacterium]|nr:glutathione S-transferase family protein [Rhodobiaceae bacterium]
MSDLVFYTNPMSRGRIVRWMLEEVGAPYRAEIVAYGPQMKGADYLAVNPMGKVPSLVHGDAVVTEAAAICAYLADAFPEAGLAPDPASAERGAYYRWLFFGAGPVEQAVTAKALGLVVPDDKRGMVGFGSLDLVLDTLEGQLAKNDYIAGRSFTAADIYVGAQIGWGMQFGTIDKRAVFERYVGNITSRPACVRARDIDDKLVAESQGQA